MVNLCLKIIVIFWDEYAETPLGTSEGTVLGLHASNGNTGFDVCNLGDVICSNIGSHFSYIRLSLSSFFTTYTTVIHTLNV